MQFKFYLRNLRMAPRKVRSVTALIKGLSALSARDQLSFQTRLAAKPILKLLKSGLAGSEKNFNVKPENLYVQNIFVDEGPMLKRFRPRAHGRAGAIHKKTSHITLILESTSAVAAKPKKIKVTDSRMGEAVVTGGKIKEEKKIIHETKKVIGPKPKSAANIGRRIFRRKAIG